MATKKPEADTTAPHDDFKVMPKMGDEQPVPKEGAIPVEVAKAPVVNREVEQPLGYRPLGADEVRRMNLVKVSANNLIDYLKTLRDSVHDAEAQRMFSVAITEAEAASMWACRAITHKG